MSGAASVCRVWRDLARDCFCCWARSTTTSLVFFFTDTATPEIYTLSLHDALPIWAASVARKALRNYARLPLSFEPNVGDSNPEVKFLSRGQGYSLFLTANRAVLQVPTRTPKTTAPASFRAISLELLGANPQTQIVASDRLPGVSNYLLGSNPAQWH